MFSFKYPSGYVFSKIKSPGTFYARDDIYDYTSTEQGNSQLIHPLIWVHFLVSKVFMKSGFIFVEKLGLPWKRKNLNKILCNLSVSNTKYLYWPFPDPSKYNTCTLLVCSCTPMGVPTDWSKTGLVLWLFQNTITVQNRAYLVVFR